ncbi:MAG TPA: AAA family ATPase [Acidimicrobiales bacterium]|nr:AAA family ATPase [Acidimicrobiales bacterium]
MGRGSELAALTRLLEAATAGRASVLVVRGEAGQGKTALVDWTAAEAARRGLTVLRATGVEFESELAFSGLSAVLRPLIDRVEDLTDVQARSLRGALGLEQSEGPALTVYGAALSLISQAAVDRPVALLVDDAQWMDRASLEALVFAAHRCSADRVGIVFAERTGVPCLLDQTRFPRLELPGLDTGAAVELLARQGVAPVVAERCRELTHGNPLALIEGARGLSPAQREGGAPLPPVLPVDERLLDGFRTMLAGMAPASLQALGTAALVPDGDLDVIGAALGELGAGTDDLGPAEAAGVVTLDGGRVAWRHPLLRCAAHQVLAAAQRRDLHGALALATDAAGHPDRAVWHLSQSVAGPDAAVAERLADAAALAYRRGAVVAAAEAYEQAARLAPSGPQRARHIFGAADVRWAGGDFERAAALLRPAIGRVDDVVTRAEMAVILGQAETWLSGAGRAVEIFEDHARAAAAAAPDLAAVLMLHATMARLMRLDIGGALEAAGAAAAAAERAGEPGVLFGAYAVRALASFFAGGGPAAEVAIEPIGQLAVANLDDKDDQGVATIIQLCAYAYLTRGDNERAVELLSMVIEHSDASGMLGRSVLARMLRAEALWRRGRWAEALAQLGHLRSLQQDSSNPVSRSFTSAVLTRLEAGLGHEAACRNHAEETWAASVPLGIDHLTAWAHSGVGLLELGAGRFAEAAGHFDEVAALAGHIGEPGFLWWHGDAIEAYHGCGRQADAADLLTRLQGLATASRRPWAQATADRAAALLGAGPAADDEGGGTGDTGEPGGPGGTGGIVRFDPEARLDRALAGFAALDAPFEEARTLLARGERRVAAGDRRAGATDIARARTIFDRIGARAWSERASRLRGEASRAWASLDSRLSPAELRVAMVVGHGASNRDAADRLFISVKTVDYHLQGIYRKLGLRSRAQLVAIVAGEQASHVALPS